MEKRLGQISLLVIIFVLIWFSSTMRVLGTEFSRAPTDIATGNSEWRLLVNGSVYHTLNLTFNELVAMPNTTEYAELYCEDQFVASGKWTGVRLGFVLEKAGLYQQADTVKFYAQDGYSTRISITEANRGDVILAYEKDGEPLSEKLRLVVPGANGAIWISMIIEITVEWVPVSIPESTTSPTHNQSPTPQQSPTPHPSLTPQPENQSATRPIIQPSNNQPVQQQDFLGSSLPIEYGYGIVAVIVVAIAAATGYLYSKRKK